MLTDVWAAGNGLVCVLCKHVCIHQHNRPWWHDRYLPTDLASQLHLLCSLSQCFLNRQEFLRQFMKGKFSQDLETWTIESRICIIKISIDSIQDWIRGLVKQRCLGLMSMNVKKLERVPKQLHQCSFLPLGLK